MRIAPVQKLGRDEYRIVEMREAGELAEQGDNRFSLDLRSAGNARIQPPRYDRTKRPDQCKLGPDAPICLRNPG
jgi:hypothetical protein